MTSTSNTPARNSSMPSLSIQNTYRIALALWSIPCTFFAVSSLIVLPWHDGMACAMWQIGMFGMAPMLLCTNSFMRARCEPGIPESERRTARVLLQSGTAMLIVGLLGFLLSSPAEVRRVLDGMDGARGATIPLPSAQAGQGAG